MKEKRISIFELTGNSASTQQDGKVIYDIIKNGFKGFAVISGTVILDFTGVKYITPTYLNVAIGQLYNDYDGSFLRKHLKVENMTGRDKLMLKKVNDNAKKYFENLEVNYEDMQ